jgi:hypothetical protein
VSGDWVYLGYFAVQYFSVNFHFLNNDKSYKSDFFTINTIDDGLPFDGVESTFSPNFFGWYHIPFSESMSTYIGQLVWISVID